MCFLPRCPMMEGSDYPQSAASPQSMDSVLTSEGKHLHSIILGSHKTHSSCHLLIPFS